MPASQVHADARVIDHLALLIPWDGAVAIVGPEGERIGRRMVVPFDEGEPTLSAEAAIARLEELRAEGCEYLLVGESAYGWLDALADFKEYLEGHYRLMDRDSATCAVYALHGAGPATGDDGLPMPPIDLIRLTSGCYRRAHDPPAIRRRFESTSAEGAGWIRDMLARNGRPIERIPTLLDFGCGCGRVMRHWKDRPGRRSGSDYNPHLVKWCEANLDFAQFERNDLKPPLPFEGESFDLVYSISIFTHLDAPLQLPWMEELIRVTRPGGLILITVSGEDRLRAMPAWKHVREPFEAGELVVRKAERVGTNACAVYHPRRYVIETLARGLEIVDYASGGAIDVRQDAILMRRPPE